MTNIEELIPDEAAIQLKKAKRIITIVGWGILLVGFFVFIFYEGTPLQNIVNGTKYWLIGVSIGVILFIGVIVFLKRKYRKVFDNKTDRRAIYISYLLGCVICILDIIGFINTTFASTQLECKEFVVIDKSISSSRYGTSHSYFIHCKDNEGDVQLQIDKTSWDKVAQSDTIQLYLKKGYFGCDYVTEFKLPKG